MVQTPRAATPESAEQLALACPEPAGLAVRARRARTPLARWHALERCAALAYTTGRYTEAVRLAGEAHELITGTGSPDGVRRRRLDLLPGRAGHRLRGRCV
jgi:hypothetical protein